MVPLRPFYKVSDLSAEDAEDAELLSTVLKKMSVVLKIDIDKNHVKQGCHSLSQGIELDDAYMAIQEEMMDRIQQCGFEI